MTLTSERKKPERTEDRGTCGAGGQVCERHTEEAKRGWQ